MRATVPIGKFTGGVQVVQGWNNIYDNNSGKTVGITGAYAWKKVTWSHNYYVGPEKTKTNTGLRQLYDTTVLVNANDNFSYYINFDYGRDKNIGQGAATWNGIAGAARYAFGKKFAVAGRLEWFDDPDGFSTGMAQTVKELTATGEYKMSSWLMSRLEFRDDWSNQPYFQQGATCQEPADDPARCSGLRGPQEIEIAIACEIPVQFRSSPMTKMSLIQKAARLRVRLKDPEWRRFGALLLTGKLTAVGLLLLGSHLPEPRSA